MSEDSEQINSLKVQVRYLEQKVQACEQNFIK